MRRVVLLATAAAATASAAAANDSAWQWRERLGLQGSACPAECPLRHRSIVNIKDFGRAGFADGPPWRRLRYETARDGATRTVDL